MKKTLLILGAGASKDLFCHFPTGLELIKDINYHLITEDREPPDKSKGFLSDLFNQLIKCEIVSEKEVKTFKTLLWDEMLNHEWNYLRGNKIKTPSIDSFVFKNNKLGEFVRVIAQYCVSYLLIGIEQAFTENKQSLENKNNWIVHLWNKLKQFPFDEINNKLEIITFNYDRSFDFISECFLRKEMNLEEHASKSYVKKMKHIYGSLGSFDEVSFGEKNDKTDRMKEVYTKFQLLYNDRSPKQWDVNQHFDQIYFLGFGYDSENMDKLNLEKSSSRIKKGTGLNFGEAKICKIKNMYGIEVVDCDCKSFIENEMSY